MSFSFNKVTTGTYNFASVIWNVLPVGGTIPGLLPSAFFVVISAETQFSDQVKINSVSQLIIGIFKLLQKWLKYFSGITTFASVNTSFSSGAFPVILVLYLKYLELEERGLLSSSL